MAEAEGIPPTASTVVPGLSLNYAGEWIYAFSGQITVNNTNIDCLDFTSGSGLIVAKIEWGGGAITAATITHTIALNGVNVMLKSCASGGNDPRNDFQIGTSQIDMIIPPFTRFVFNTLSTTAADFESTVWITGRVYDA